MSCVARASTAKAFSSPMRSKARTVFSMESPLHSRPLHHRRHQCLDVGRTHLLHHRAGLDAQELEHALDAGLSEGAETPGIGPADADGGRAHAQSLDDV